MKLFSHPARVAAALAVASVASASGAFVYEGTTEFSSQGDFDGDGRPDLVIVDKATGNYRIGYQLAAGVYTWVAPRPSGIANLTGFSVANFLSTSNASLAFAAPDANCINVLEATDPAVAGLPLACYPDGYGPNQVIGIDIGGPGNTPLDDLLVGTTLDGLAMTSRLSLIRNDAGAFTNLSGCFLPPFDRGNRVLLQAGDPERAVIVSIRGGDFLEVCDLTNGLFSAPVLQGPMITGSRFACGSFDTLSPNSFLCFVPGQSSLTVKPVQATTGGMFNFLGDLIFTFTNAIEQVIVLPAAPDKLLMIFDQGASAGVYNFDGINAPALVQWFTAGAGEAFTGAGPLAAGGFNLYSGRNGATTSTHFQVYNFSGGGYLAGAAGELPPLSALSCVANVFLFQWEPFAASSPNLLRSLSAGNWSSSLTLTGTPLRVTAAAETFFDAASGLRSPVATSLGLAPVMTSTGLVNQYREPISVFSYSPARGDAVSDVTITPPPGTYKKNIQVTLTAGDPTHLIFYRLNSATPWMAYTAPLTNWFQTTTISYFATPPFGGAKSAIKTATYSFKDSPSTLDSDGDGVPDYVELAHGLDPTQGRDSDGDGYSDLDELLAGTDPNNPASFPGSLSENNSSFDLALSPRPIDGPTSNLTVSASGTAVRAYTLSGSLLGASITTNLYLPWTKDPAARLTNILIDTTQPLFSAATEEHFDINTSSPDTRLGRELLRLLPMPTLPSALNVPYTYGGGALGTEAANWVNAARLARPTTHTVIERELTAADTLCALLFEHKIGQILTNRGWAQATNLTLFPFRAADAGRFNPDAALLSSLEYETNGAPAYLLAPMYTTISNQLSAAADTNLITLLNLACGVYRLSSLSNNSAPGSYRLPVDVIRTFLGTGVLDSNYAALTLWSSNDLAGASAGADNLLDSLAPRPLTNVFLQVWADTFTGPCTVLETVATPHVPMCLFHAGGVPYQLLDSFNLVINSQLQVVGYADVPSNGCLGTGIEVVSVALVSIPTDPSFLVGPLITLQPQSQTNYECQAATFEVAAVGAGQLSYQWQQSTTDIPGATNSTYTTPDLPGSASGAEYRVLVANFSGSVTSLVARVTVLAGTSPSELWLSVVRDNNDLVISWPTPDFCSRLQVAETLLPNAWTNATQTVSNNTVRIPLDGNTRFFRLIRP